MTINTTSTKEEMIADIKNKISLKIFEPETGNFIIHLIEKADTLNEAFNVYQLGTNYTKTGLHYEIKKEKLTDTVRYFKKDDELSFNVCPDGNINKLVIGDNYDALQNLLIQYRGMIDVIYIDPPYGKDSMGEFAETNYQNAITRDNLLSMLFPRLFLARQLLSKEGVIFVSIDDKNQAYIKCLMDDIFGEANFICCMPRKSRGSATTKSLRELQVLHDYVLLYCNNYEYCSFTQDIKGVKKYPYHDDRGDYYVVPLQDNGPAGTRTARPKLYYPIYRNIDGSFTLEPKDSSSEEYLPARHKNDDGRWMWSKEKFLKDNKDLTVVDGAMRIKHYFNPNEDQNKYTQFKSWLDSFQNSSGTLELNSIMGKGLFDNPKPVDLLSWLVNLGSRENSIVLDFFAGSGTLAQAVLEQPKEKNLSFILVQLDEDLDKSLETATETAAITLSKQIEFLDSIGRPHKLSEITCERLRRIMTGKSIDGSSNFEWLNKNKPFMQNLDVYHIADVSNKEQGKGKSAFEVIDETLYGYVKFENINDKIKWVIDNFENTQYKLGD